MSQSECEKFLLSILEKVQSHEKILHTHGQQAIKEMHQKFM